MRQIPFLLLAVTLVACTGGAPARSDAPGAATRPNVPVADVDLERYAGTWYEQARLPMYFQRKCASDTTANYRLNADGTVAVVNRCRREDGGMQEAEGVARMVDGRTSTLEVRFAPAWLSWLPAVWGDYWVIALDEADYQWAMVGAPKADYLWILSRSPQLDTAVLERLLAQAREMGYPVDRVVATPQSGSDEQGGGTTPPTASRN